MKVRSYDLKIKKLKKKYITLYLIVAEVTVKIHERLLLSCSAASDPENVKKIDWHRCSTYDCKHDLPKSRIARVQNMTVTVPDQNLEVYTNGTLVIKKVLPADDGKWFICIPQMMHVGRERSTTILLHIAKGDIYTSDNSNNKLGNYIFSSGQSTW